MATSSMSMAASQPASDPAARPGVQAVLRRAVVVMGVSGCGKSSVGAGVAAALGLDYVDGDDLHDAASVSKMRAGLSLTDLDRWPWLGRIGARLADAQAAPPGLVVACSALRRDYRDCLRGAAPGVSFVFLDGPRALIRQRMEQRLGHYMPAQLLDSQLQTLERPGPDEPDVLTLDIDAPVATLIERAAAALQQPGALPLR